jgi:hypothetical protein
MEGKPYRGDIELHNIGHKKISNRLLRSIDITGRSVSAYFPDEYQYTSRLYPAIYVIGDLSQAEQASMANVADEMIRTNDLPPFVMVFLSEKEKRLEDVIIPEMESKYRVRPGFRYRSLFAVGKGAWALEYALKPERYTSCTVMSPVQDNGYFNELIRAVDAKKIGRTWFFFGASDKTPFYRASGDLHLSFKEKGIYHEYRVMQGDAGNTWKVLFQQEAFRFTLTKMHR